MSFFKHNNLTDFEKLLFAEKQVEELVSLCRKKDVEIGKLFSEVEELKYLLKKEKPEASKLRSYKIQIKNQREKYKTLKFEYDKILHELILIKNKKK